MRTASADTGRLRDSPTAAIAPRVLSHPGMGLAVVRIAVAMAVEAGFLFALTLRVQGGLSGGARRSGLTFAPNRGRLRPGRPGRPDVVRLARLLSNAP